MPGRVRLILCSETNARAELERIRDHHALPYMRERAAALLKIADGQSGRDVAAHGLYKERWEGTVYDWVRRYRAEGVKGLVIRPGRGRKPAFSPQYPDNAAAHDAVLDVLHRDPRQMEQKRSRWTLRAVLAVCKWLRLHTEAGLSRLLRRLDVHWKRGRDAVHSPDGDYLGKVRDVQVWLQRVWQGVPDAVLLFQDELTYYRQPSIAQDYEMAGHEQPLARRSYQTNTRFRITAAVDALTGQVHFMQRSTITVHGVVRFYEQLCAAYGPGRTIYLAQDNWPVHFHPNVLAALEPQCFPWPLHVSPHWPKEASAEARHLNLPIQILPLPTYAPWTNPAEKLWRWLKQQVLHLHPLADDLAQLRDQVCNFLNQFAVDSDALLRYVGLLPN